MAIRITTFNVGGSEQNPFKYKLSKHEYPITSTVQESVYNSIHKDLKLVQDIVGPCSNIGWLSISNKHTHKFVSTLMNNTFLNAWKLISEMNYAIEDVDLYPWGSLEYEPGDTRIYDTMSKELNTPIDENVLWSTWIMIRCFWYYVPYRDLQAAKKEINSGLSWTERAANQVCNMLSNTDVLLLQDVTRDLEKELVNRLPDYELVSNFLLLETEYSCVILYKRTKWATLVHYETTTFSVTIKLKMFNWNYIITSIKYNGTAKKLTDTILKSKWCHDQRIIAGDFNYESENGFDVEYARGYVSVKQIAQCVPMPVFSTKIGIKSSMQLSYTDVNSFKNQQRSLIFTNASKVHGLTIGLPDNNIAPSRDHVSDLAVITAFLKW